MAKQVTREQAERKKQQAVTLMARIGDSDRAEEFDDLSVDEYAEHRGLQIANPRRKARKQTMATKNELQGQLDSMNEVLSGAYTPEASREDIASAHGCIENRGVQRFHEERDGDEPRQEPLTGRNGIHGARVADGSGEDEMHARMDELAPLSL